MWQRYTPLIAAVLALAIFPAALSAFAEQGPAQVTRYKDYEIQKNADGTITHTLGKVPYVWDAAQGKWVDRIIQNNGTHFNVYSDMGSFSFDKSDCTMTQYAKGFDPTTEAAGQDDIIIGDWFWTVARKNGANPWEVLDASMFACNITVQSNSTGKYLSAQRNHASGSYLRVDTVAPPDGPVEDFGTFYMNIGAWSGNKFAPVLWAKNVKADSITFRNGTTIEIPQGVTIIDRSQLTLDSLDFVKNGNAFFLDWKKAAPMFKTLLLNRTGSSLDVQFGFNNNAITLGTGQKMKWDPTYGYTNQDKSRTIVTANSVAATCSTTVGSNNTNTFDIYKGNSGVNDNCRVGVPSWNIGSIPNGAAATNIKIRFGVSTVLNMGSLSCVYKQITNNPYTSTMTVLLADARDGTIYARDTLCRTTGAAKVVDFGTNGTADFTAALNSGQDWISYGISFDSMARDGAAHQTEGVTAPGPYNVELEVTYSTTPPNPPTNLSAVSQARKALLSWTQTNGTGVNTYYVGRSLDNSTWTNKTSVGNVTSYLSNDYWRINQLYYVNVTASGAFNSTSAYSSFTTDNFPSVPRSLLTTAISSSIEMVSWTAPLSNGSDTIAGYRVEASVGSTCSSFSLLTNLTASLNYNHTGLTAEQQYCYRVGAWNGVGLSPYGYVLRFALPDAVRDLETTSIGLNSIDIAWTQPGLNGGTLLGYKINYTTPTGTPNTVLVNNTNSSSTAYVISGLTENTAYCMRVGAWTYAGNNGSGNIVCATTFGLANFTIGFFDVNQTNSDIFPIRFERSELNSTATNIKVIYPNTADLDCSLYFTMAQDTLTYNNINGTTYDATMDSEDFIFEGSLNDIVNIRCMDSDTNDTATYVLQQQGEFVLLDMIRGFRNGDYGTSGMFGALDLVTLIVVISSMIGFNRVNEAVGAVFNSFLIGALAWFEIITFPTIMFGALFIIVLLAYLNTRKD